MIPKGPFFSRKNILLTTVVVLSFYILVLGGALLKSKINHDHRTGLAKAQQAQINRLSPEEKSIRLSQSYLIDSISLVKPEERLLLDYLQRKFDLDTILGITGPPFDLSEDPRTYPEEIHYLARIAYPDKIVKVMPKSVVDGVTLTNIYSANCDHLPLPSNYWQTMERNAEAGGYSMTHVALALVFMKDNNCPLPLDINVIKNTTIDKMSILAEDQNTPADLRYEAIAFLYLTGHREQVQHIWINQIIQEQNNNGSWNADSKGRVDTHTTILALWALLEYSRTDVPDEPIIRHP